MAQNLRSVFVEKGTEDKAWRTVETVLFCPGSTIVVDILGPLPMTISEHEFLIIVRDGFSKWSEEIATTNRESKNVAEALLHRSTVLGIKKLEKQLTLME